MFHFSERIERRRPSLTPMIDVVFLLLVFFMLAAQFGTELAVPISLGGAGTESYQGPPRLIRVAPDTLALNGVPVTEARLPEALARIMTAPSDPVLLRAVEGANLQRLMGVLDGLRDAGIEKVFLVE